MRRKHNRQAELWLRLFSIYEIYCIRNCLGVMPVKTCGKVREEASISGASGKKAGLEIVSRWNGEQEYGFLMNFTDQVLPVPERFAGKEDLLTEKAVESGETMKKYDVKIVKM